MIVESKNNVKVESTSAPRKMKLKDGAVSMIFRMFTRDVYSNPIGSIVREITSNCFDSHIEAKVKEPVVIKYSRDDDDTHYMSFIDFGVGMSPDRVYNIYGTYFESTKNTTNDQIGGFGIGGKTPLAYIRKTGLGEEEYDNSFYVITKHNGVEYTYMICEGTESPEIIPVHEQPTTDHNGTEIKIPVLSKDIDKFCYEMTRQLYYFEDLVYVGFENIKSYCSSKPTNDYSIVNAKNFYYRGSGYSNYIHICLGRVAYPIDYSSLGIINNNYSVPVAIKFNNGEIKPTMSRENIDYNEDAIKLIKSRLNDVINEIKDLVSKQHTNVHTLEDYFKTCKNLGTLNFDDNKNIYVGNIINISSIKFPNFKYKSFDVMPSDMDLFSMMFNVKKFGSSRSYYNSFSGDYSSLKTKSGLLYIEGDEFNRVMLKQSYLKDKYYGYCIINKTNLIDKLDLNHNTLCREIWDNFKVKLNSIYEDDGKLKTIVQDVLNIQEDIFNILKSNPNSFDYDKFEVPESFKLSRKRNRLSKDELKSSISVRFMDHRGNFTSYTRIKLKHLVECSLPIVYFTSDTEYMCSEVNENHKFFYGYNNIVTSYSNYRSNMKPNEMFTSNYVTKHPNDKIMFIKISKTNVRHMKNCKNAIPITDHFNKYIVRKYQMVVDFFEKKELYDTYSSLPSFYKGYVNTPNGVDSIINHISPITFKCISEIKKEVYDINSRIKSAYEGYSEVFIKLGKKFNLTTSTPKNIKRECDKINKIVNENVDILSFLRLPDNAGKLSSYKTDQIDILKNIMKF